MSKSLIPEASQFLRSVTICWAAIWSLMTKRSSDVVGTLWSIVAKVKSGRRTLRPARRRPSNACGEVTSCTRCRSIYSSVGSPSTARTTCVSQTFSKSVFGFDIRTSNCVVGHLHLQKVADRLYNSLADGLGIGWRVMAASAEIGRDQTTRQRPIDRLHDLFGLVVQTCSIAEQHCRRLNRPERIGHTLAGDIWRGPMYGFVQLDFAADACRRQHTQRTADNGRFVGENVAEEVFG